MRLESKPPVTVALIAANFLVFFKDLLPYEVQARIPGIESGCIQPFQVVERGQWGRLLWSAFLHADEAHIYYNMSSLLWKGVQLERRLSSVRFAALVGELLLVSHSLLLGGVVLLHWGWREYRELYYHTCTVGFSAVLFGLKVVLNYDDPGFSTVWGVTLPTKYICWAELFIISAISPNASFMGHLAGILAGLIHVHYTSWLPRTAMGMWRSLERWFRRHGRYTFSSGGQLGGGNTRDNRRASGNAGIPPRPAPRSTQQQQQQARAPSVAATHAPVARGRDDLPQENPISNEELRARRLARFGNSS